MSPINASLFRRTDSLPITFALPLKISPITQKQNYSDFIVKRGGRVVSLDDHKEDNEYIIKIIDGDDYDQYRGLILFRSTFVVDCCQKNELLFLVNYRLDDGPKYRASDMQKVLTGDLPWNQLKPIRCKRIEMKCGTISSSGLSNLDAYKIANYIFKHGGTEATSGLNVWKKMEEAQICPGQPWEKLKSYFFENMVPEYLKSLNNFSDKTNQDSIFRYASAYLQRNKCTETDPSSNINEGLCQQENLMARQISTGTTESCPLISSPNTLKQTETLEERMKVSSLQSTPFTKSNNQIENCSREDEITECINTALVYNCRDNESSSDSGSEIILHNSHKKFHRRELIESSSDSEADTFVTCENENTPVHKQSSVSSYKSAVSAKFITPENNTRCSSLDKIIYDCEGETIRNIPRISEVMSTGSSSHVSACSESVVDSCTSSTSSTPLLKNCVSRAVHSKHSSVSRTMYPSYSNSPLLSPSIPLQSSHNSGEEQSPRPSSLKSIEKRRQLFTLASSRKRVRHMSNTSNSADVYHSRERLPLSRQPHSKYTWVGSRGINQHYIYGTDGDETVGDASTSNGHHEENTPINVDNNSRGETSIHFSEADRSATSSCEDSESGIDPGNDDDSAQHQYCLRTKAPVNYNILKALGDGIGPETQLMLQSQDYYMNDNVDSYTHKYDYAYSVSGYKPITTAAIRQVNKKSNALCSSSYNRKNGRHKYSTEEDVNILHNINNLRGFDCIKGVRLWKEISKQIEGRSWLSLKNRYNRNIRPKLKNDYSKRTGIIGIIAHKLLNDKRTQTHTVLEGNTSINNILTRKTYSREQDAAIIRLVLKNINLYSVGGVKLWECIVSSKVACLEGKSWQSLKERYRKRILPNLDSYGLCHKEKCMLTGERYNSSNSDERNEVNSGDSEHNEGKGGDNEHTEGNGSDSECNEGNKSDGECNEVYGSGSEHKVNGSDSEHNEVNTSDSEPNEVNDSVGEHNEVNTSDSEHNEVNTSDSESSEVNGSIGEHNEVNTSDSEHNEVNTSDSEPNKVNGSVGEHNEVNNSDSEHNEVNTSDSEHNEVNTSDSEPNKVNGSEPNKVNGSEHNEVNSSNRESNDVRHNPSNNILPNPRGCRKKTDNPVQKNDTREKTFNSKNVDNDFETSSKNGEGSIKITRSCEQTTRARKKKILEPKWQIQ